MTNAEVLTRAVGMDNFSRSVLLEDKADDWMHVKDVGEYLIRVDSTLLFGHLLLARSCRHLGELVQAAEELRECRNIARCGNLSAEDSLLPVLEDEEKCLVKRIASI